MTLLITGATGYIGRELVSRASREGMQIVCATRTPCQPEYAWLNYDLRSPAPKLPADIKAVIHLAADTSTSSTFSSDYEVEAARDLLKETAKINAKFIFVSSQAASPTAPSSYGRTKWNIEQIVLRHGGVVIRPGQVYGGTEQGLFGLLVGLVRQFPVIPVFLPAVWVQPLHIEDLCLALLSIADSDDAQEKIICLGAAQPVSFTHFLKSIADNRLNRFRLPLPLPTAPIKLLGWIIGQSLSEKYGLSRMLSLVKLRPMNCSESLEQVGIVLRPLAQGMYRLGHNRHRHLLREGVALLSYLLKTAPKPSLVRRYVYALQSTGRYESLFRSGFLARWPTLLNLLDTPANLARPESKELALRLQFAVQIAEASPQGAHAFLNLQQNSGLPRTLLALLATAFKELSWRLLATLCQRFTRQLLTEREVKRES